MGRGRLVEVLPDSVRALFARAAQEPGDTIEWRAQSGRAFQFRLCRNVAHKAGSYGVPTAVPVASNFFEPLADPDAIERLAVTEALESTAARPSPTDPTRGEDDALVGTLVHRLFQFAGELPVASGPQDIVDFTARLIRPDERAMAANATASVARAIAAWMAMKAQPGVSELIQSGERMHELPFSCQSRGDARRVLRGTIDCLVRRPDGTLVIIEFKTGAPSPSHQAQLDIYLEAARAMFPGTPVQGRIVYPR